MTLNDNIEAGNAAWMDQKPGAFPNHAVKSGGGMQRRHQCIGINTGDVTVNSRIVLEHCLESLMRESTPFEQRAEQSTY